MIGKNTVPESAMTILGKMIPTPNPNMSTISTFNKVINILFIIDFPYYN